MKITKSMKRAARRALQTSGGISKGTRKVVKEHVSVNRVKPTVVFPFEAGDLVKIQRPGKNIIQSSGFVKSSTGIVISKRPVSLKKSGLHPKTWVYEILSDSGTIINISGFWLRKAD